MRELAEVPGRGAVGVRLIDRRLVLPAVEAVAEFAQFAVKESGLLFCEFCEYCEGIRSRQSRGNPEECLGLEGETPAPLDGRVGGGSMPCRLRLDERGPGPGRLGPAHRITANGARTVIIR